MPNAFDGFPPKVKSAHVDINESISKHANLIITGFYHKPLSDQPPQDGIARPLHGGVHVSRVTLLVPILANLYRKHGDTEALRLTDKELKLLQIAALFHDSARESDGKDLWDRASAENCYYYLTRVAGVSHEEALRVAEAAANKDLEEDKFYYRMQIDQRGNIEWIKTEVSPEYKKSIYQRILQTADSLDIMRITSGFNSTKSDFWNDFQGNTPALDDLACLVVAHRNLTRITGDTALYHDRKVKYTYEYASNCYDKIAGEYFSPEKDSDFEIIRQLYNGGQLLPQSGRVFPSFLMGDIGIHSHSSELTESTLLGAIMRGEAYARTLASLEEEYIPPEASLQERPHETRAEKELSMIFGVPGAVQQTGNPDRSFSIMGFGSRLFCHVGYVVVEPLIEDITGVIEGGVHTGYGDKSGSLITLETQQKCEQLQDLRDFIKTGGAHVRDSSSCRLRNEVTMNVKPNGTIKAIVVSFESREDVIANGLRAYEILRAIYLQQEYKKKSNIELPIFMYNPYSRVPKALRYSENDIVNLWKEYATFCATNAELVKSPLTIDSISSNPMFKNYPAELQGRIRSEVFPIISLTQQKLLKKYEGKLQEARKIYEESPIQSEECSDPRMFKAMRFFPCLSKVFKNPPPEFLRNNDMELRSLVEKIDWESLTAPLICSQLSQSILPRFMTRDKLSLCENVLESDILSRMRGQTIDLSNSYLFMFINSCETLKALNPERFSILMRDFQAKQLIISENASWDLVDHLFDLLGMSKDHPEYFRLFQRSILDPICAVGDIGARTLKVKQTLNNLPNHPTLRSAEPFRRYLEDAKNSVSYKASPGFSTPVPIINTDEMLDSLEIATKVYRRPEEINNFFTEKLNKLLEELNNRLAHGKYISIGQIISGAPVEDKVFFCFMSDLVDFLEKAKQALPQKEYTGAQKDIIKKLLELRLSVIDPNARPELNIFNIEKVINFYTKNNLGIVPPIISDKFQQAMAFDTTIPRHVKARLDEAWSRYLSGLQRPTPSPRGLTGGRGQIPCPT